MRFGESNALREVYGTKGRGEVSPFAGTMEIDDSDNIRAVSAYLRRRHKGSVLDGRPRRRGLPLNRYPPRTFIDVSNSSQMCVSEHVIDACSDSSAANAQVRLSLWRAAALECPWHCLVRRGPAIGEDGVASLDGHHSCVGSPIFSFSSAKPLLRASN